MIRLRVWNVCTTIIFALLYFAIHIHISEIISNARPYINKLFKRSFHFICAVRVVFLFRFSLHISFAVLCCVLYSLLQMMSIYFKLCISSQISLHATEQRCQVHMYTTAENIGFMKHSSSHVLSHRCPVCIPFYVGPCFHRGRIFGACYAMWITS